MTKYDVHTDYLQELNVKMLILNFYNDILKTGAWLCIQAVG
jgi:hypothetical protein